MSDAWESDGRHVMMGAGGGRSAPYMVRTEPARRPDMCRRAMQSASRWTCTARRDRLRKAWVPIGRGRGWAADKSDEEYLIWIARDATYDGTRHEDDGPALDATWFATKIARVRQASDVADIDIGEDNADAPAMGGKRSHAWDQKRLQTLSDGS